MADTFKAAGGAFWHVGTDGGLSAYLSKYSDLHECARCSRQWATNHDTQITLPFYTVASFYRRVH